MGSWAGALHLGRCLRHAERCKLWDLPHSLGAQAGVGVGGAQPLEQGGAQPWARQIGHTVALEGHPPGFQLSLASQGFTTDSSGIN